MVRSRWWFGAAIVAALAAAAPAAGSDSLCLGNYGGAPPRAGAPLRFGIDPGLAGSTGAVQLPVLADDPQRDLVELERLRPPGRVLVLRLNRLFWSDGTAGIASFKRAAARDARAGFEVEIQVRYHPPNGEAGNMAAWTQYVRRVVDALGSNRSVVAMTITNEVNVTFSPNTSDGAYPGAAQALIDGIEAAHREARRRGDTQLRFGFTYAYRFVPSEDAAFFSELRSDGGKAFDEALGFVGLDFYPGSVYPPVMAPGDSYRAAFAQAAGTLRECFMPLAGIAAEIPIWITENGVPSGPPMSQAAQAAALEQLVRAARDYSGTFNITDYRWFNLRDATANPLATPYGFASDGLLSSAYAPKPAFADYRALVERFGSAGPFSRAAGRSGRP
jgi:hypothetical protein